MVAPEIFEIPFRSLTVAARFSTGDWPWHRQSPTFLPDIVSATQPALAEGLLPGDGVALLRASTATKSSGSDDAKLGDNIIVRACRAPAPQIAANAGIDRGVI